MGGFSLSLVQQFAHTLDFLTTLSLTDRSDFLGVIWWTAAQLMLRLCGPTLLLAHPVSFSCVLQLFLFVLSLRPFRRLHHSSFTVCRCLWVRSHFVHELMLEAPA